MSAEYDIPMCPGVDPGADWQEMGWCCHDCAALAHILWCPNHPGWREADLLRHGDDADAVPETDLTRWGETAMTRPLVHDIPGNPDTPVPFTLTPKAHGFLDVAALAARYAGAAIIDGALFIETALGGFIADGAVGWACGQCGFAWFGPVPEDGLCPNCVATYRRDIG